MCKKRSKKQLIEDKKIKNEVIKNNKIMVKNRKKFKV